MKKPLKIVLLVLAAVLLVVISYLAYVLIDYHRLGDMDLEVDRQVSQPAQTGCEYHLLSYNIGFGAYEPDYGFFMDGGTESWAWSEERLKINLDEIAAILTRVQGHPVTYVRETIEEAYESRKKWPAAQWQYDSWVSTYTSIARGEMDVVSTTVCDVTGRDPLTFEEVARAALVSGR